MKRIDDSQFAVGTEIKIKGQLPYKPYNEAKILIDNDLMVK